MRRSLLLGLLLACLALAAAGSTPAGGRGGGGVLRLGFDYEPGRLDPALAYTNYAWQLEYATCANLFNYPDRAGDAGAQAVPEVVRRTTVSRDGRTYTFDLKRTFRFQTGAPVDAASFAAAIERDADPQMGSPAVAYLHEIVGADAVIAGKENRISGVRVLAPYRLQIRLTRPLGDLTARLAMPLFCPVPSGTPRQELDLPPGSGPYYVANHVPDRRIVLRRNPYYRGDRPVHVDEIDLALDVPREDCVAATEADRVDWCLPPIAGDPHRSLAKKYGINRPGGRYFVTPTPATFFLAFNHNRPAFEGAGQIPLAKAINYAIDRPALARGFGYLSLRRTDRILPPVLGGTGHYYPIRGADPETARRWFAKARLQPHELVLYTSNGPGGVGLAQILAYDLRQLGIELTVKSFSLGTELGKAGTRGEPYDIALYWWQADYPDPITFFGPLLKSANLRETRSNNVSFLDDLRVDAAIDAADRLTGAARRTAFVNLDATLMRDDPPWAPFANSNDRTFVSQDVGCVVISPVYGFDIAAACKK